jgi:hypothetical protein
LKSQFSPGQTSDKFGNRLGCSAGTIPMKRMTLEEMSHFANLRAFFEKGPNGFGQAVSGDQLKKPVDSTVHKHAITYQYVNNLGGQGYLNLWTPFVNNSVGQDFSLSQQWYIGGPQTAEVGWHNLGGFGHQASKLFVYYTADNYQSTGCYNLSCGAFVQVNNSWTLGGAFPSYSVYGGDQAWFTAQYYLYSGNWWLAINGTWIGYYPTSIYQGGQMAYNAQLIEYGGEVDAQNKNTLYPQMGSGDWATNGYTHAAFQSQIFYMDTNNVSHAASLSAYEEAPSCYLVDGTGLSSDYPYFYFGGPGGYFR